MKVTRDLFDPGHRRGPASEERLIEAYQQVFGTSGEDLDLVLGDLAEASGYYFVTPDDATALQMARSEGARKVFARILSLTRVSPNQLEALREAALLELQTSNEEQPR